MRTIQAIATAIALAALAQPAQAQLTRPDAGPVRPAAPQSPREPAQAPETLPSRDRSIRVDIDGIDGVIRASALDQDFSMGEQSGRRLPQATVTLTREPDEYTAALLRGHTRGTRFRDVTITQSASAARARFTVRLADVVIEAVRIHTGAERTVEAVTLRFGKIAWSDADGNSFEWNYATMSPR